MYTGIGRIVPGERTPLGISAEQRVSHLADVETGRVHRLVPSDVSVLDAEFVAVIRDRGARQQDLNHVEAVQQQRVSPGSRSRIVMISYLKTLTRPNLKQKKNTATTYAPDLSPRRIKLNCRNRDLVTLVCTKSCRRVTIAMGDFP